MSVSFEVIPEEDRLDILFEGNLDVSVWQGVYDACKQFCPSLKVCIVDLTRVRRVFDSGIAILGLLHARARACGTTDVFLTDDPTIRTRVAAIASPCWHQPSRIA